MPTFREAKWRYLPAVGDIFVPEWGRFNRPDRIVTLLGTYLSNAQLLEAHGVLNHIDQYGIDSQGSYTATMVQELRDAVRWTRWIIALNQGRKWARTRISERLLPLLEESISIAVVPSHNPFHTEQPIRLLAQMLAATGQRNDATACLVRHTRIPRIVYGGRSDRTLHRETIRVDLTERVAGKRVLLLDDIARSGQSLMSCREMLLEAGAEVVQAAALGRIKAL